MSKSLKTGIALAPVAQNTIALNGGGRSNSHRINQICDRYAEIMRRAPLPDLTDAEWSALQSVVLGRIHEPAAMIARFSETIADAIDLDGLAEQCGIDGSALVKKLQALSYAQEVRLVEHLELLNT